MPYLRLPLVRYGRSSGLTETEPDADSEVVAGSLFLSDRPGRRLDAARHRASLTLVLLS